MMNHSEERIELKVVELLAVLAHVEGVLHWMWLVVLDFLALLSHSPAFPADVHILHHETSPLSQISLLLFFLALPGCFLVNHLLSLTGYLGLF